MGKEYEVKISFNARVNEKNLEDLKNFVDHHLEYVIDESYFKSYYNAHLTVEGAIEDKQKLDKEKEEKDVE